MDYIKPSMEFILLNVEDVIRASTGTGTGLTPEDGDYDDSENFGG